MLERFYNVFAQFQDDAKDDRQDIKQLEENDVISQQKTSEAIIAKNKQNPSMVTKVMRWKAQYTATLDYRCSRKYHYQVRCSFLCTTIHR